MSSPPPAASPQKLAELQRHTACDVSDALQRLAVPGAGFIPDLVLRTETPGVSVAPASTVLFVSRWPDDSSSRGSTGTGTGTGSSREPGNIPAGACWADLVEPHTFVVVSQPDGQTNAVCGGIMAARMGMLGARGIVVVGRARDVAELRETGLAIWSRGLSTVGAGAASFPQAVQVPLLIGDVVVRPGDVVVSDPANGVVVIPLEKLDAVLELLPRLTAADGRVMRAVKEEGMSAAEALAMHRGNL